VRRSLVGFTAFLALSGTFVVLPVYAAPTPAAKPIEPSIHEVALGSVTAPAGDAVVTTDGEAADAGSAAPSGSAASSASTATAAPSTDAPSDQDVASSGKELPGVPALTVSQPDTDKFSSVGVTWAQGAVTDVVVQLRVKNSAGHWGSWTTVAADDIEQTPSGETKGNASRGGTAPYWTGESYGVEVIVQGAGGAVPDDVKVALIDPGKSAADKLTQAPSAKDTAHAAEVMPAVYSRAQWGADESIRTWDPEYASTLKAATIHHTADTNNYTADQVPALMRSMYAYHTITRGWGDIGYNVIVDKFGRIFEGRYGGLASTVIGAHAGGFNTYTFGVSMLGNYDTTPVPQATVNAVAEIIAWKFGLYGINPNGSTTLVAAAGAGTTSKFPDGTPVTLPTIFGHRDVGSTACPGQYGYARLAEIRAKVAARVAAYDVNSIQQKNSLTGNIVDASPVTSSAVVSSSGATTVFARGTDGVIYYRTGQGTGTYTPWAAVPNMISTGGPSAVSADGASVQLVVRGPGMAVYRASAPLDPSTGVPGTWSDWASLGGVLSTAPSVASVGPDRYAVVGRGSDGATWERVYDGTSWSEWASVGGAAFSAPAIEADNVNGSWRYIVSVVGTDWKVWRLPTAVLTPRALGAWTSSGDYTSHGPGSGNTTAGTWGPKVLSTGGADHSVVLADPQSDWYAALGGSVTGTAAVARQPDGTVLVFARGGDKGMWMVRWSSGGVGTWTSLGGGLA
jgi:hypothetical protein